jgi:riboflavin synthase
VDGVCLTAVAVHPDGFEADVIAETLARTTLGSLGPGSAVNLERALRLSDRLGGHLVQGHVDTTAEVLEVRRQGDDYRLRLESPGEVRRFLAYKGSVALQGVSLTIAAEDAQGFEVALIPETLARTTLGTLEAGERVNVEVDLLARYLEVLQRDGDR